MKWNHINRLITLTSINIKRLFINNDFSLSLFREHYGNVIFLYISDELEWGRKNLGIRKKAAKDLYFVGEGEGFSEQR